MAIIDDRDLRELYRLSSGEHLQTLETGLLRFEQNSSDRDDFAELLRAAHTLKGDSRMLGVNHVEKLVHQVEHVLKQLQSQELSLTPLLAETLYNTLDAVKQLVQEATEELPSELPSAIDPVRVLARLMQASSGVAELELMPLEPSPLPIAQTPPASFEGNSELIPEPIPEPQLIPELIPEPIPEPQLISDLISEQPSEPEVTPSTTPPAVSNSVPALGADRPASSVPTSPATTSPPPARSPDRPTSPVNSIHSVNPITPTSAEPYHIDTIRVATRHLDGLVDRVGELAAIERRLSHQAALLDGLVRLWEELRLLDRGQQRISDHTLAIDHRRSDQQRHQLHEEFQQALYGLRERVQNANHRLEAITDDLKDRTRSLRLLPLATVFQHFPRMVRDLAQQQDKAVTLVVEGGETTADKQVIEALRDPLLHLVRNAIDHGIESAAERQAAGKPACATLRLWGAQQGDRVLISLSDDGRGLDRQAIIATAVRQQLYSAEELAHWQDEQIFELILLPGFSTRLEATELSGRGVGLDAVRVCAERLKGRVMVQSKPGQGCTITLTVGTTLAATQALLVMTRDRTLAIPLEYVHETRLVPVSQITALEGRPVILLEGEPVSATDLGDLLELPGLPPGPAPDRVDVIPHPCVVLVMGRDRLAVFVDRLIDVQEIMLKPQSKLLVRVRNVSGVTILGNGDVCPVLHPPDLFATLGGRTSRNSSLSTADSLSMARPPAILLVEDSIATRTQEKRILETAGYDVVTATDGMDALHKLRSRTFDAIVSDIQMPRLDGLGLTARIRQMPEYDDLPIVLVSSLNSDADKRRGAEAGANAYLTKDAFNQAALLGILRELARSP
ncbi:response regulator [Limnothrix redekei]|uniref:histidine kinase n=1 Tax=Limnothrix redekei LRLZ20PSL1 TaxID=3112953 RepID=A0ABW7C751_9CYAN